MSGDGEPVELAWNGSDWYVAPEAPGGPTASYLAVSCVPLWCLGIGYDLVDDPADYVFLASAYTWTNP